MALQGLLSHPKRYITTHNEEGRAIIHRSFAPEAPFYELTPKDAEFAQCYVTQGFPVKLGEEADLDVYRGFLSSPPGLVVAQGTVLRYVDMPPGAISPMHRTVSLDYGVVLEGYVELILDSGETRILARGDVCIQRGTMHSWRNTSKTEWARMLYILQPINPIEHNGQVLTEDYGNMQGVKASE
ncbi:hypothetical protein S40285_09078 [Stachybotrys chlorohalonatus IBT 40285]|uniref:Cupin type-2 domain-containing protein n=1 Tax=Stachybotrys chlorohalonatus (strain IBT 40285) TaxID=1283841 RepID=A0A084QW04_STAC4|nr:hypothetical protein S40285_09078 [Stachybotrys chlorohalonata IBT 40285]